MNECECNLCRAKREGIPSICYAFPERYREFIIANPGKDVVWYSERIEALKVIDPKQIKRSIAEIGSGQFITLDELKDEMKSMKPTLWQRFKKWIWS
jgi:hypothetical protein